MNDIVHFLFPIYFQLSSHIRVVSAVISKKCGTWTCASFCICWPCLEQIRWEHKSQIIQQHVTAPYDQQHWGTFHCMCWCVVWYYEKTLRFLQKSQAGLLMTVWQCFFYLTHLQPTCSLVGYQTTVQQLLDFCLRLKRDGTPATGATLDQNGSIVVSICQKQHHWRWKQKLTLQI